MKNAPRESLASVILPAVGVLGVITLSLAMPNILLAIPMASKIYKALAKGPGGTAGSRERRVKQALFYLKRHDYIRMKRKGVSDYVIRLTGQGKKRMSEIEFEKLTISKPKVWNKKWWLVAGDIPTKQHRRGADLLRAKLKQMQFYALQRSMWFYPYDPRKELEFILTHYVLSKFVTVMEVSKLDLDDKKVLTKHFKKHKIL